MAEKRDKIHYFDLAEMELWQAIVLTVAGLLAAGAGVILAWVVALLTGITGR